MKNASANVKLLGQLLCELLHSSIGRDSWIIYILWFHSVWMCMTLVRNLVLRHVCDCPFYSHFPTFMAVFCRFSRCTFSTKWLNVLNFKKVYRMQLWLEFFAYKLVHRRVSEWVSVGDSQQYFFSLLDFQKMHHSIFLFHMFQWKAIQTHCKSDCWKS